MYTSGNVNLNVRERAFLCFSMFPVSNETTSTELVAVPILLLNKKNTNHPSSESVFTIND